MCQWGLCDTVGGIRLRSCRTGVKRRVGLAAPVESCEFVCLAMLEQGSRRFLLVASRAIGER